MKTRQASGLNASSGPVRSLVSRTRTPLATSTHSPLGLDRVLARQSSISYHASHSCAVICHERDTALAWRSRSSASLSMLS